jgi:hypothetical protein
MMTTRAWLARHGFPHPEQVQSCQHYHYKYIYAYEAACERSESVIVIDDMMEKVVRSFGQLAREQPAIAMSLLRRLEVTGFGAEDFPPLPRNMPFAFSLLPSWQREHLDTWLARPQHVLQRAG